MFQRITVLCLLVLNVCYSQQMELMNPHNGLMEKIGNFSMELLYHTGQSQAHGGNFIISPITVWTVFAVIAEGATDDTLKQICESLRILPNKRAETRKEYQEIIPWLQINTPTVELQKFNALFADTEREPLKDFQSTAKEYDTRMIGVDFSNAKVTSKLINTAISAVTHNRIPSVVDSDALENSNLVLVSALYFKAQWATPFNASATAREPFYDSEGKLLGDVNMMHRRHNFPFATIKELEAHVLELPYDEKQKLSMLVLLPHPGVSLNQMFYNLGNVTFNTVFENLKIAKEIYSTDIVNAYIPRFKIESSIELSDSLKKMGIKDVFDQRKARLPLMTKVPVFVSRIIHKAEIEVTEEGTTASAVTVSEFENRIGYLNFKANRPFCYVIIEKNTNSLLFGGFYQTPTLF